MCENSENIGNKEMPVAVMSSDLVRLNGNEERKNVVEARRYFDNTDLILDVLSQDQRSNKSTISLLDEYSNHLESAGSICHQLEEINEQITKDAQLLKETINMFDRIGFKTKDISSFQSKKDCLTKMNDEELESKLNALYLELKNINLSKDDVMCLNKVKANLNAYQRLIKGAIDLSSDSSQSNIKISKKGAKLKLKTSLKETLHESAISLNMPSNILKQIKKLELNGKDTSNILKVLINMARHKQISEENIPEFILNIIMPKLNNEIEK